MQTFVVSDPRFDNIEYAVNRQSGARDWWFISYRDCKGDDDPCPRRYNTAEECLANVDDELTFIVKYWGEQLDDRERAIVADGTHYRINPVVYSNPVLNGFAGRTFRFKDLNTGEVIECGNTWYQGVIPEWARKAFPDTHSVV